ncbi:TniQ family protein [Streptomyces sp. DT193]|uniref:TniQ family protein n=1 Tax=Streptomyces sp. DT193 TaxID=3393418 RepID=UPI003CE873AC
MSASLPPQCQDPDTTIAAIVSGIRPPLPIRVDPVPGEAIDSWLETVGRQLRTPWNELLPALGLGLSRHPQKQPRWIAMLQAEEAAALSVATQIDSSTLHQMTLAHYDGRALRVDRATRLVRGRFILLFHPRMRLWCAGVGSRQEMVFSPVRRRAMRSAMAMWIMASERAGRVS